MSAPPAVPQTAGMRFGGGSLPGMLLMGTMMGGASIVDAISGTMLPITARHFTDNVSLIACMVALNRVFGFVVQPYAAWKSDRHQSSLGRRRPFLLVSWPATLVCVGLLGALPVLVPAVHHRTTTAVILLFGVNLGMQAFVDVCYGSADPLYGDMFRPKELGRANGTRMIVCNVIVFVLTAFFIPLADIHEFYPYLAAIGFLAISTLIASVFLRENPTGRFPAPQRYNPLKPLRELSNPQTRNVALVSSAVLVSLGVTEMLHALFVTETLGFSKTVLGLTTATSLVFGLICPYPLGSMVDRIGARRMLIAGFVFLMLVELGFVVWVHDLFSLYVCLCLFKIAWMVVHLPVVPLIFHDAPPERRGTVFAAVQMTRAAVTSGAVILAGFLADLMNSYRICYLIAAAACLAGIHGALRLEPTRKPAAAAA
ncbi:MAG: MFS transporter [Opitutaceae bacterium]|nr:MFS transporter [Opitutaceae bacterium]